MQVKQLKKLCKQNNLHKYSRLKKENLISLLKSRFLTLQALSLKESQSEIVVSDIPIVLNEKEQINISIWFRMSDKRLSRWLTSKEFIELLDYHCEVQNLVRDDLITENESGDTFVDLLLTLATVAKFSLKLRYDILLAYTYNYTYKLKQKDTQIAALKYQLELLEQGISADITLKWETFNFSFAYYILIIDNIVKCGAVGLNNSENSENLDARLAAHRATYARFKLINLFQFIDSKSVTHFENWIKTLLRKHSIGKNGCLEQYEFKNQDTALIINEIVTSQFEVLKKADNKIGSICPQEKIKNYNQTAHDKTNN